MTMYMKRSTDAGYANNGTAAGSWITILDQLLVTLMGWTKTSLGTNLAKYTMPAGTNGFSLQVDDSGANSARVTMWETLTAFNTGTGQTPTTAQLNGGIFMSRIVSGSWRFFSNGKMCYLFHHGSSASYAEFIAFGDFSSYKTSDAFGTCIIGPPTQTANTTGVAAMAQINSVTTNFAAQVGHFIVRSHTQLGSSITAGKFSDYVRGNGNSAMGAGGMTYPSPIDGGLYITPIWLIETGLAAVRGLLPGLWAPCHVRPFADGDTFTASSGLAAGRSFEVIDGGTIVCQLLIETSDTWGGF